jgi:hypothetical protein
MDYDSKGRPITSRGGQNPAQEVINRLGWKKIATIVFAVILGLVILIESRNIFDTNKAGHVIVKQAAVSGQMSVIKEPGMFLQVWGDLHSYLRAGTVYFDVPEKCAVFLEKDKDALCVPPIPVRFNDGATAAVKGSARYELPMADDKMIDLHVKFRSFASFVTSGVERLANEAVILTASFMSAEESYTTRRARFAEMAGDQLDQGVYLTQTQEEAARVVIEDANAAAKTKGDARAKAVADAEAAGLEAPAETPATAAEPATGKRSVAETSQEQRFVVRILRGPSGQPLRRANPLAEFEVNITQFVVSDIDYADEVDTRIKAKQEALQAAIQAGARAEQAKQQALQAEQEGLKNVMTARYESEVIKTKAVIDAQRAKEVAETEAQQRLAVNTTDAQAAEQYALKVERESKADAAAKDRLLRADNGFQVRIDTYLAAVRAAADAYQKREGAVVPQIVMGGGGGSASGPSDLLAILAARVASDLGVSVTPRN